ncbi:MAG: hypothetical protein Q8Q09_19295 [Deltaproteobacteria bacterium]|nr:hypothetical protein [Deltaproteobacteria bacterium]
MTHFGTNIKVNVSPSLRENTQRFYTQGLSATCTSPNEQLDLFAFAKGETLGVFYNDQALTEDEMRRAPWLEFAVSDPDAVASTLLTLGGTAVKGLTNHPYIAAPGGLVFRLSPNGH